MKQLFQLLIRYQITPNQFYLLYHFKNNIHPPLINVDSELMFCKHGGWISADNKLTAKSEVLLNDAESMFKKIKTKVSSDVLGTDYMEQVKAFRALFPIKSAIGNRTLRSSPEELKERFIWFFNKYPDYTWETVLKATAYYIEQNEHSEYISTAGYYISKQEKGSNLIVSKLANDCQAILDGLDTTPHLSFYDSGD